MLLGNASYPEDDRVRNEATSLVRAGYAVAVIAPGRRGQRSREIVAGVEVFRYPDLVRGSGLWTYTFEYVYATVASLVLGIAASMLERTSVVHAHNPPDTYFLVASFFKLFGGKFVYDHHDLAPELYRARFPGKGSRPSVYRALTVLEGLSCRLADRVITTNESYRQVEIERAGVPAEKVTVVRNGPGPDKLRVADFDPELRSRAGTMLAFVGDMGYHDGVDYLLRVLQHMVYDLGENDVYCVLVGKGDAREDMRSLASSLGLEGHTSFPGYLPDDAVRRILCTADICIDPDPSNEFTDRSTMLKMMDYMALGRPIVAFDLPEHRATAGDAALFVRPNDELEMARAIIGLMADPARRSAMGEIGRRRVEEKLAWHHSVEHLLGAYRALFAHDSSRSRASGSAPA